MPNQIEVKNLSKSFGKHQVLKDVSLEIPAKKIFGIIGPSGCGKTTLLKTMIGFWDSDSGEIRYETRDLKKNSKFIRQIVGFATQENCVYPKLTVRENLRYFGTLSNVPKSTLLSNIEKVIKFVRLEDSGDELAENLSGGMQRRLDIACALVHNPRILILDEPTEDLDPILRKDILALIKKINQDETTVVMTSHLLHEAEQLCDIIAILHNGRLLKCGTPEELRKSFSKEDEIHLITLKRQYSKLVNGIKSREVKKIESAGNRLVIKTTDAEKTLQKVLHQIRVHGDKIVQIDVRKPSLSEIFVNLVKKSGEAPRGH
ncbi:ABC transporter ATP-binding protein [Candidatus Woesearchaeota archaeon]|nr:ABC transporter ATP-binding protein [Candidatus Woesearchaeota archaeon]